MTVDEAIRQAEDAEAELGIAAIPVARAALDGRYVRDIDRKRFESADEEYQRAEAVLADLLDVPRAS